MVDTETNVNTGNVIPFMYAGEMADTDNNFEIDDTVNIPRGEYEELIEDSVFLGFLRETVGEEVWANAEGAFEKWSLEQEDDVA